MLTVRVVVLECNKLGLVSEFGGVLRDAGIRLPNPRRACAARVGLSIDNKYT